MIYNYSESRIPDDYEKPYSCEACKDCEHRLDNLTNNYCKSLKYLPKTENPTICPWYNEIKR